jgi:hypothetical protein
MRQSKGATLITGGPEDGAVRHKDGGAIMALAQGRKLISKQFGEIKSVCQRAGKKLPIFK